MEDDVVPRVGVVGKKSFLVMYYNWWRTETEKKVTKQRTSNKQIVTVTCCPLSFFNLHNFTINAESMW